MKKDERIVPVRTTEILVDPTSYSFVASSEGISFLANIRQKGLPALREVVSGITDRIDGAEELVQESAERRYGRYSALGRVLYRNFGLGDSSLKSAQIEARNSLFNRLLWGDPWFSLLRSSFIGQSGDNKVVAINALNAIDLPECDLSQLDLKAIQKWSERVLPRYVRWLDNDGIADLPLLSLKPFTIGMKDDGQLEGGGNSFILERSLALVALGIDTVLSDGYNVGVIDYDCVVKGRDGNVNVRKTIRAVKDVPYMKDLRLKDEKNIRIFGVLQDPIDAVISMPGLLFGDSNPLLSTNVRIGDVSLMEALVSVRDRLMTGDRVAKERARVVITIIDALERSDALMLDVGKEDLANLPGVNQLIVESTSALAVPDMKQVTLTLDNLGRIYDGGVSIDVGPESLVDRLDIASGARTTIQVGYERFGKERSLVIKGDEIFEVFDKEYPLPVKMKLLKVLLMAAGFPPEQDELVAYTANLEGSDKLMNMDRNAWLSIFDSCSDIQAMEITRRWIRRKLLKMLHPDVSGHIDGSERLYKLYNSLASFLDQQIVRIGEIS